MSYRVQLFGQANGALQPVLFVGVHGPWLPSAVPFAEASVFQTVEAAAKARDHVVKNDGYRCATIFSGSGADAVTQRCGSCAHCSRVDPRAHDMGDAGRALCAAPLLVPSSVSALIGKNLPDLRLVFISGGKTCVVWSPACPGSLVDEAPAVRRDGSMV